MLSIYYKTEGLVMRKMPIGEADFLVRILTSDFGKVDVLSKGARKQGAKLNAHTDMLNYIRFAFVKNGPDTSLMDQKWPTLIDAEILGRLDDWFLDAERISVAGRILKTLDALIMPGIIDKKIFLMALDFFSVDGSKPPEKEAYKFVSALLAQEGYVGLEALPSDTAKAIMELWSDLKI